MNQQWSLSDTIIPSWYHSIVTPRVTKAKTGIIFWNYTKMFISICNQIVDSQLPGVFWNVEFHRISANELLIMNRNDQYDVK